MSSPAEKIFSNFSPDNVAIDTGTSWIDCVLFNAVTVIFSSFPSSSYFEVSSAETFILAINAAFTQKATVALANLLMLGFPKSLF